MKNITIITNLSVSLERTKNVELGKLNTNIKSQVIHSINKTGENNNNNN